MYTFVCVKWVRIPVTWQQIHWALDFSLMHAEYDSNFTLSPEYGKILLLSCCRNSLPIIVSTSEAVLNVQDSDICETHGWEWTVESYIMNIPTFAKTLIQKRVEKVVAAIATVIPKWLAAIGWKEAPTSRQQLQLNQTTNKPKACSARNASEMWLPWQLWRPMHSGQGSPSQQHEHLLNGSLQKYFRSQDGLNSLIRVLHCPHWSKQSLCFSETRCHQLGKQSLICITFLPETKESWHESDINNAWLILKSVCPPSANG